HIPPSSCLERALAARGIHRSRERTSFMFGERAQMGGALRRTLRGVPRPDDFTANVRCKTMTAATARKKSVQRFYCIDLNPAPAHNHPTPAASRNDRSDPLR